MTNYEKLRQFYKQNAKVEQEDFFNRLMGLFNIKNDTAYNIWYAEQRSWFKPEMIDELIRLDHNNEEQPNLLAGDFEWINGKFVAEFYE